MVPFQHHLIRFLTDRDQIVCIYRYGLDTGHFSVVVANSNMRCITVLVASKLMLDVYLTI
jgi:hypothetical protein